MRKNFAIIIVAILMSAVVSAGVGYYAVKILLPEAQTIKEIVVSEPPPSLAPTKGEPKVFKIEEESAVVEAVKKTSPAVVSIIITQEFKLVEKYYLDPLNRFPQYRERGTETRKVGGGSGFIMSDDGFIVTNKHVVLDPNLDYTVLLNDNRQFPAKVLARDPFNDVAILKINGENLPTLELGDSDAIQVGQSVIAIGNALSEFSNTVSTGVVSGLSRSITAGPQGGRFSEELAGLIQTDASINPGNSGGPLLNLAGQVIGINTAIVQGAQNIGFAIPINSAKHAIESVKKQGRIVRPWLGVRYAPIDKDKALAAKLPVTDGVIIFFGGGLESPGVIPGSPAEKAGLQEGDIITEIDGQRLDENHSLANLISLKQPGDQIKLKVLRDQNVLEISVMLEEMKNLP